MASTRRSTRRPTVLGPSLALVFALLLLTVGCAKRSGGEMYLEEPGYAGDDYAYDYYDESEADMDAPPAPESVSRTVVAEREESRSSRNRSSFKAKKGAGKRDKATETTSPDEDWGDGGEGDATEPEPTSELDPQTAQPGDEQPLPSKRRQVIYTATMAVGVYDLPAALAFAENIPTRYGGWLQQRANNEFVLRVPAEQLETIMGAVAELGVVEARTLAALDVTAQYTDLESRIRVLEEMQAQLALLLEQAKTVEQSLEIRKVLDEITLELEAARAQMRSLAQSVAFSTLILSFSERGPGDDLPSTNDPFSWVDRLGAESTEFR